MILKDLIIKCDENIVINKIIETYPREEKNKEKYKELINKLRNKEPQKEEDFVLYVKPVRDIIEPTEIYHESNAYSKETKMSYACDYIPFNQWLAMEIAEPSLNYYGINNFVAHVLWDMTIISFDEEKISKEAQYLEDISNYFHSDILQQQSILKNHEYGTLNPDVIDIEPDMISQSEIDLIIKENNRIEKEMLGID